MVKNPICELWDWKRFIFRVQFYLIMTPDFRPSSTSFYLFLVHIKTNQQSHFEWMLVIENKVQIRFNLAPRLCL